MFKIILLIISLLYSQLSLAVFLRDPTRPPNALGISSGLRVDAVLISSHRKMILIDGRYLTIGDKLAGGRIIDIERGAVHLQGQGGKFTIPILSHDIKQSVDGGEGS